MKRIFTGALLSVSLLACGYASVLGISANVGEHYTTFAADIGKNSSGLYLAASSMHNSSDGQVADIELGLNIPVSQAMINVGAKALYLNNKLADQETAAGGVSAGLALPIGFQSKLIADVTWAPEALSGDGIDKYLAGHAGVAVKVIDPLSINIGYSYAKIYSDKHDVVLTDGPYIGASLTF